MNEDNWLACEDPTAMLRALRGITSDRKIRLFGVACCYRRGYFDEWSQPIIRSGISVAERFADGQASVAELLAVHETLDASGDYRYSPAHIVTSINVDFVSDVAQSAAFEAGYNHPGEAAQWEASEVLKQVMLLRDIFGNPFRPVASHPAWLTWRNGTIPLIAQAIYEERRYADMPILADALEEAGCSNADILNHCRQPGEHVRGCWVVDLLLGKT